MKGSFTSAKKYRTLLKLKMKNLCKVIAIAFSCSGMKILYFAHLIVWSNCEIHAHLVQLLPIREIIQMT